MLGTMSHSIMTFGIIVLSMMTHNIMTVRPGNPY
jgi:hypothetical protein